MPRNPMNIVLCSDGTGNTVLKGRGTNVFKLYEAIDHNWTETDPAKPPIHGQIAFYDDGVGTENLKWLRVLTGAVGIGVRRNVKCLYTQLARVYQPGDQIYLFGFSRGAYTVRMLAGLIAECGIPHTAAMANGELPRCAAAAIEVQRNWFVRQWFTRQRRRQAFVRSRHAEVKQQVKQALADFWKKFPVWLPDGIDANTPGFHQKTIPADANDPHRGVRIRMIGVWDTVDAYGFPIDEVADFWDRFIYPYRFPDTYLSPLVDHACHALAIDDERLTFAPVLWQARRQNSPEVDPRIEQVWFAGAHANVGGGYVKHGLSLISLDWMIAKAEEQGLQFLPALRQDYRNQKDVNEMLYDSRSGFGAFYRYLPRDILALSEEAGIERPTIHRSVLERIEARTDEYAPANIPEKYRIEPDEPAPAETDADGRICKLEIVQDIVWWRRVFYYLLVTWTLGFVFFCWWHKTDQQTPDLGAWTGHSRFLHALLNPALNVAAWLTPSYFESGVNALRHYPTCTFLFLASFLVVFTISASLVNKARNHSFVAWRSSLPSLHGRARRSDLHRTWWIRLAHWARHWRGTEIIGSTSRRILPVFTILGLLIVLVSVVASWLVPAASVALNPRAPDAEELRDPKERVIEFDTGNSLQATPVILVRGEQYRITVASHSPWKDKGLDATPDGVIQESLGQKCVAWLRRDPNQPWFRLLGSLGPDAATTFPIGFHTVIRPERTARLYLFTNDVFGFYHNNQGTAEIRIECLSAPGP